jgi:flagellin-specific chaperone FliS
MDRISFKHILNEERFYKLKREFLLQDIVFQSFRHTKDGESVKIDDSINSINVSFEKETIDDFELDSYGESYSGKSNTVDVEYSMNFYDDYLYPKMKNQLDYLKQSFEKEIKAKAIYETTAIQRFCSNKLKTLAQLIDDLNNSCYLDSSFKIKIIKELEKLYEYINTVHLAETLNIPRKIPFKLTKNQVVVLFSLFHKNKIIGEIPPLDLHRLIEAFFTYYDDKELKFKEIKKSKKAADELLDDKYIKSAESTLQSLEDIFSVRDFFNPE